jgi:glycerol kinase
MLMNLDTLQWDAELLDVMDVPPKMLPTIKSSSEVYGQVTGVLGGVAVAGDLGDQQAALFGQTCFSPGETKNTYGTGCFLLINTGNTVVHSKHGLITTAAYRIGKQPTVYALEGSIAIAGALVQWLRDNLGIIEHAPDVEGLARSVHDNGGIYFVPAFSGLYAPYWKDNARGVIVGMTRYINKGHIARASLEAAAYQTREIVEAMQKDTDTQISTLKVDGGMVANELLMQFQADIVGIPTVRPSVAETTSLGAAYAAGLAVGFWEDEDGLRKHWHQDKAWQPVLPKDQREHLYNQWRKAVTRTFDWVE